MKDPQLQYCPECRQPWPPGAEHDLRGLGWLGSLPRNITPSNSDILIHDRGEAGERDRMLVLEVKTRREQWPLQRGQAWALMSMARRPDWIVRILRGSLERMMVHRVTPTAIEDEGPTVSSMTFRGGIVRWLNGMDWPIAMRQSQRSGPRSVEAPNDFDTPEFQAAWDQIEAQLKGTHRDAA